MCRNFSSPSQQHRNNTTSSATPWILQALKANGPEDQDLLYYEYIAFMYLPTEGNSHPADPGDTVPEKEILSETSEVREASLSYVSEKQKIPNLQVLLGFRMFSVD